MRIVESPQGLGSIKTYDVLKYKLEMLIREGAEVQKLDDNLFCIERPKLLYFWYQNPDDTKYILAAELMKRPHGNIVTLVAKREWFRKRPPFASDLYVAIQKHTNKKVISDVQMSDEGYNTWKRLVRQGHQVTVYDNGDPEQDYPIFRNEHEMEEYFKTDDTNYEKYQFVLLENTNTETQQFLNRIKQLSGI